MNLAPRRFASIILLLLSLSTMALAGQDGPIRLVVGEKQERLYPAAGLVDGKVFVPMAVLDYLGARVETKGRKQGSVQKIEVTGCNGRCFTSEAREIAGEMMVPILDFAPRLNVAASWDDDSHSLTLQARVTAISFDGYELRVNASCPVNPRVSWWNQRLIVHMDGAILPDANADCVKSIPEVKIRIGNDIVMDMPQRARHKVVSSDRTALVVVSVSGVLGEAAPIARASAPSAPAPVSTTTEPEPEVEKPEAPPVRLPPAGITGVDLKKENDRRVTLTISATGAIRCNTSMTRSPARFVVDIPNATVGESVGNVNADGEIVRSVRVEQRGDSAARVTVDLSRVVISGVRSTTSPSGLEIGLELPKSAGGLLSSKIIVIDPGHGGKQSGARAADGCYEKRSNFEIAQRVQRLLADAGACALMTRTGDTVLGLQERVDFARRQSANIFVSIHGNSCTVPGARSGLEFYYHKGDTSGRELADCIRDEVTKVAGMRDWGVKQDPGRIGFAVLRYSSSYGMPASLLELGFVNSAGDWAKVSDPAWQEMVAEAIVRGIRAYVEGSPNCGDASGGSVGEAPSTARAPKVSMASSGPTRPGESPR